MLYEFGNQFYDFPRKYDDFSEFPDLGNLRFRYYACFCGETTYQLISTTTRHGNHLNFVQCHFCGTLRANPYLTDESIEYYYKSLFRQTKHENTTPRHLFEKQVHYSNSVYEFVQPWLDGSANILDYGCGAGGMAMPFLNSGHQAAGIEFNQEYLDYGIARSEEELGGKNGLKVHREGQKYDLLLLSEVLDHMNEPASFVETIRDNLLRDEGMIYVSLPVIDTLVSRRGNVHLFGDLVIAHKWYFTVKSLTYLFNTLGFGLVTSENNRFLFSSAEPVQNIISSSELMRASNFYLKQAEAGRWKRVFTNRVKRFLVKAGLYEQIAAAKAALLR